MTDPVKPRRRYKSAWRDAQAAATRRAILDAALRLFEQQGYGATTVEAIADEAGVSLKTVYVAFSTKSRLLRALWDLRLKGDQDDTAVADRPWYQEVLDEPDPARQLRLNARNSRRVKERIAPLLAVIRDAAPLDADTAALWSLIQSDFWENQRAIVVTLHRRKALRRGLDIAAATDILWALNHPDMWMLLVVQRGWSPERYERWFADTSVGQLVTNPGRRSRGHGSHMWDVSPPER